MNEIEEQIKDESDVKSLKMQASQKLIESIKNSENLNKSFSKNNFLK
jgi:hypothetical protein